MSDSHHHHGHSHGHSHGSAGNLKVAFALNLAFTVIEVIGGILTNSVAILSDAVHDLGDSMSLGLAWYFQRLSQRGRTSQDTYGYRRYALLGGLITGLVLVLGLGFVLWNAVQRLLAPEPVNAPGMILLAIIGVVFNGAAVLRVKSGSSLTEKVVTWHLIEDVLGWVAVLVGAVIMTFWNVPVIDPLLSIGISVFIIWNVVRNLRQVFEVIIQKVPASFDVEAFEREVLRHPKVISMHDTHSWSVDGEIHVLTTHLVMQTDASRDEMIDAKSHVRTLLDEDTFEHVTVDVELEGELCVIGSGGKQHAPCSHDDDEHHHRH
ncbi:cation diffusion facilitator family transporter [Janthinobacterium sp. 17J80-10]|uniref:cation diffusion facilitator family transporter n=1 Tax=Janthinobacterium sp. 17J80-10 TaxID=2497863 RepID=UPI0010054EC2|nr:cation diffusion facilitator family transporter [Janthinobacterium sp. 17J80-10]QAU33327.1 cation transporter [Janthinobacterium sp. 17J80-10]